MKLLLLLTVVVLTFCECLSAEVLTTGVSVGTADSALKRAGYAKTELEMEPQVGEDLRFWQAGRGVLIVNFSKSTHKITKLTFWFADERPKALRQTFEFDVASFDTNTGIMTIRTKKR